MEKFCQSCGMPLNSENLGTESDGSKSSKYCNYCYENGKFIEPDITIEEMISRGKKGIDESSDNFIKKAMLKMFYPMQIKGLDRWKASKNK
ncbi:zinc ribbon domain-containing protein [Companilactobacillus metriopterae]|uniref:zinc ribbon domain-containing protein n=1 Tax=Companilactobacillus metriopterae TaxID=1909267 RepID=UPI00100AAF27|nr:zinc ribbon domain-containing protein [Companilactobacillus metriopterae]